MKLMTEVEREFYIRSLERRLGLRRVLLQEASVSIDFGGPQVGTAYLVRGRDLQPDLHMVRFLDGQIMPPGNYNFIPLGRVRPAVISDTVQ